MTLGEIVAYLRRHRARMQQPILAADILDLWNERLGDRNSRYGKSAPDMDSIRTAISEIENGRRELRWPYTALLADVLDVPRDIFRDPPKTIEGLDSRIQEHSSKATESKGNDRAGNSAPKRQVAFSPNGLPKITNREVFRSRDKIVDLLQMEISNKNRNKIIVLSGPSGSGKSSLLRRWFIKHGSPKRIPGFFVPCTDKTGERIAEEILHGLRGLGIQVSSEEQIIDAVIGNCALIILDGVGQNTSSMTDLSNSHFKSILPLLLGIAGSNSDSKILVTRTTEILSSDSDTVGGWLPSLDGMYHEIQLAGLPEEDGAHYLRNLRIEAAEPILEGISRALNGNPTDIFALASSVREADRANAEYIERLSIDLELMRRVAGKGFATQLFESFLDKLRVERPYEALMLLVLAAAREDISLQSCDYVLKTICRNRKLRPAFVPAGDPPSTDSLLRSEIQGIVRFEAGRAWLHQRPRNLLTSLIGHYLDAEQRKLLYILLARASHRRLPSRDLLKTQLDQYDPNHDDIKTYHNLIFYLVKLYEIYKSENERIYRNSLPRALNIKHIVEHEVPIEDAPGVVIPLDDILEFAYNHVTASDLAGDNILITRQLGNYEQKLGMLTLFLEDPSDGQSSLVTPKADLGVVSKTRLVADIAICALRSGRLFLADQALAARSSYSSYDGQKQWGRLATCIEDGGSDEVYLIGKELFLHTEHLNTRATVLSRRGDLDAAIEQLKTDAMEVSRIIDRLEVAVYQHNPARFTGANKSHFRLALISARRVLAKYAQILGLTGSADANGWFDCATRVEKVRSSGDILRGETGRTYCRMLLRDRRLGDGSFDKVKSIIADNLKFCAEMNRYYEVVEWLIEKATYARVIRNADMWIEADEEATSLLLSRKIGLSFSAYWELELERTRCGLRFDAPQRDAHRALESGVVTLQRSGHVLLQCDSWLLLAEIDRKHRGAHLANARDIVRTNKYGFRQLDLSTLESGGTALNLA